MMINKEKVIPIIITTKNVNDKATANHFVVNGIENIDMLSDKLLFNGKEAIYIHLKEPIEDVEINKILCFWCKMLVDKGLISWATHQPMGVPEYGDGYHTIYDINHKLIENRYIVSFVKYHHD